MDLMNNLLFTARNSTSLDYSKDSKLGPIEPDFTDISSDLPLYMQPGKVSDKEGNQDLDFYAYGLSKMEEFCAVEEPDFIDKAIQKHWFDMVSGRDYKERIPTDTTTPLPPAVYSRFRSPVNNDLIPPYHLIYAYLVENTRCVQIFGKLLHMYLHDEKLNKATTSQNRKAFQWMMNTETLFYKPLTNTNYRNLAGEVRLSPDATRLNAYFRLFGIDLAFGDAISNKPVNYVKAEYNNQPFIALFEKFLTEVWQAYVNASNTSGANTSDFFVITDTAQKIREMLMSRRTTDTNFNNYRFFNLSREEYSSVVMMSWLHEVITYDSPVVEFLGCNGNTPGERLINIGNKVGLPAHKKSEGLLDIAPPMNTLLRRIELDDYSNIQTVTDIIQSQAKNVNNHLRNALNDLLLIINNWEKATGHKIKNPQASLVNQNGARLQPV